MINLIKVSSSLDLHEWLVEVRDLEAALDCLPYLLVFEESVDIIVRSNYELGVLEVDITSLDFPGAGVPICPDLEVVKETGPILV